VFIDKEELNILYNFLPFSGTIVPNATNPPGLYKNKKVHNIHQQKTNPNP